MGMRAREVAKLQQLKDFLAQKVYVLGALGPGHATARGRASAVLRWRRLRGVLQPNAVRIATPGSRALPYGTL